MYVYVYIYICIDTSSLERSCLVRTAALLQLIYIHIYIHVCVYIYTYACIHKVLSDLA